MSLYCHSKTRSNRLTGQRAVVRVPTEAYDGEARVGAPSCAGSENEHIGLVDGASGALYQCRAGRLELLRLLVRRGGRARSHGDSSFPRLPSGIHGTWRHPTVHGEHT
eukprot:2023234-Prymnesium_polylepis.2